MRLLTIWSSHYMTTPERFRRTFDWAARMTATKLPSRIRYWAVIHEVANAVRNNPSLPEMPAREVFKNLSGGPK